MDKQLFDFLLLLDNKKDDEEEEEDEDEDSDEIHDHLRVRVVTRSCGNTLGVLPLLWLITISSCINL